jgi:hypothetical protein
VCHWFCGIKDHIIKHLTSLLVSICQLLKKLLVISEISLTTLSRFLVEKLMVSQTVSICAAFHGTSSFFTVLATACHWILSCERYKSQITSCKFLASPSQARALTHARTHISLSVDNNNLKNWKSNIKKGNKFFIIQQNCLKILQQMSLFTSRFWKVIKRHWIFSMSHRVLKNM